MQDLGEFVVGNVTLNILERLIPGLEPATYRFWWKAFAIALRLEGWIDNNPLECMVMINPHNASSKSIILHKSLLGSYFGRVPYSSSLYLSRFVQPQSRRNRYMFLYILQG